MAKSSINLDRQADAKVFSFGSTGAGNEALVTVNKGTAADTTVVLDVKASQNIAGDLNLSGDLYMPMTASRLLGSGTGSVVTEITLGTGLSFSGNTLNATASGGTVTTVSVASANGFAGSVSNATSTPAITISTTVTGMLKGNGTAISAATSGTDYSAGTSALGTGILKSTTGTGALSIAVAGDFPTLNQNTTGSAATLTTGRTIGMTGDVVWTSGSFNGSANVTGTSTIQNSAVTLAKMANVATGTIFYRKTAGTGAPEVQTLATLATDLGISGTNTGDQTITLTGDVTGSGTGTFTATLAKYTKAAVVSGTQNGTNKVFTIGSSVKSDSEMVFLNGQLLNPGSGNDYLISGTTVTFQSAMPAPTATDVIRIYGVY